MIKKLTILTLLTVSIMSCSKDACFECTKTNSTRGMCGEDARAFKKDMENEGYSCSRVSE